MLCVHSPAHLSQQATRIAEDHPHYFGHLFATSGTTGQPKWILHSQEGLDWCADKINSYFDCGASDIWGLALPTFHVGGFGVTHRAKRAGGSAIQFPNKWEARLFVEWLKTHRVTIISLVPTQVFDIVQAQLTCPPSVRLTLIGGDSLNESLYQKIRELGWPIIISYGMTETAGMIAVSDQTSPELTPLPDWKLKTSKQGTLCLSSPGLFIGRLREHGLEPTPEFYTTNDLVEITADNTLKIVGRQDQQVKVLGELVDLGTLRNTLQAHYQHQRTTVITIPDERKVHLLLPIVEGGSQNDANESIAKCNLQLPPFSQLEKPVILENFPLSPLGKIDFSALKRLISNGQDYQLPSPHSDTMMGES